jgi:hypothetical protein
MADNKKTEDRIIIDQLGAILILFGIIEICWGFYAAPKGQFKLNCGLLLLGLVILFGNLRVVSGVRWLAWLGLAPAIVGLLTVFITSPAGLIQTALRLAPLKFLADQVPGLVALAVIVLVIRQLGSAPVLAARASAGRKPRDMRIPLALGVVLAAVLGITAAMALNGDNARRAERLVAERMGPNYRYHTIAIGVGSGSENYVQASVQAWNENELLLIPVRWED